MLKRTLRLLGLPLFVVGMLICLCLFFPYKLGLIIFGYIVHNNYAFAFEDRPSLCQPWKQATNFTYCWGDCWRCKYEDPHELLINWYWKDKPQPPKPTTF